MIQNRFRNGGPVSAQPGEHAVSGEGASPPLVLRHLLPGAADAGPEAARDLLSPPQPIPGLERIAVLRANGIGDLLFAVPALKALRQTYRNSEIVLLAGEWQKDFLAERGIVDRVIAVPPSPGVRDDAPFDEAALPAFFEAMQAERFDLAIQLHGGGRNSNPFVKRLGARLTLGLRTPDAEPLDMWVPYFLFQPEVTRYLEVVGLIGARPVELQPSVSITPCDLAEARPHAGDASAPLVALNPGATDPRRRWPPERFAAVGDALASEGAAILITGGPEDLALAEEVRRHMQRPARSLAGRLSLNGLTGLLSLCDLIVSNDTGPLHLAAAVGTPSVGIYWAGNLINGGPFTRAWHRPLASWRLDCPDCGRETMLARCEHNSSFVDQVQIADVIEQATDLLGAARRDRGRRAGD